MLNEFQLSMLSNKDLNQLAFDVRCELRNRKNEEYLNTRRSVIKQKTTTTWNSLEESNEEKSTHNSSNFFSLPFHTGKKYQLLSPYLPALLNQNWNHLYFGGDMERKYYVYAHVDPRLLIFTTPDVAGGNYGGLPFYIGKGSGERAWDLKRNQGHGKIIKDLLNTGFLPSEIIHIAFTGLSESEAFEIEAKLIYFFGTTYERSHHKGCLINLDLPKTPKFFGVMEPYSHHPILKNELETA